MYIFLCTSLGVQLWVKVAYQHIYPSHISGIPLASHSEVWTVNNGPYILIKGSNCVKLLNYSNIQRKLSGKTVLPSVDTLQTASCLLRPLPFFEKTGLFETFCWKFNPQCSQCCSVCFDRHNHHQVPAHCIYQFTINSCHSFLEKT